MKRIAVIGTGYVGLGTGTCFAELRNDVITSTPMRRKLNRSPKGAFRFMNPALPT